MCNFVKKHQGINTVGQLFKFFFIVGVNKYIFTIYKKIKL
jgi:hypothetical protein